MSIEAISRALNLAPERRDHGGERNPACKAVLVGLANHTVPDGTQAFPSVKTPQAGVAPGSRGDAR